MIIGVDGPDSSVISNFLKDRENILEFNKIKIDPGLNHIEQANTYLNEMELKLKIAYKDKNNIYYTNRTPLSTIVYQCLYKPKSHDIFIRAMRLLTTYYRVIYLLEEDDYEILMRNSDEYDPVIVRGFKKFHNYPFVEVIRE